MERVMYNILTGEEFNAKGETYQELRYKAAEQFRDKHGFQEPLTILQALFKVKKENPLVTLPGTPKEVQEG